MAFAWDWTEVIFGVEHSMPLMSMFLVGSVDALTTVVFPHYMAMYKTQYISSLYIGQGICTFLAGLLGLAQGVGGVECVNEQLNSTDPHLVPLISTPTFSITVYFVVVLVIVLLSSGSFFLVQFHKSFAVAKCIAPLKNPENDRQIRGVTQRTVRYAAPSEKSEHDGEILGIRTEYLPSSWYCPTP